MSAPYVWQDEYWCNAADSGAWRRILDPLDQEDAKLEMEAKAREHDRAVSALLQQGFVQERFVDGNGKRRERWLLGGREFTGAQAVAKLNEMVRS